MRCLVTGGAGFIGSYLVDRLMAGAFGGKILGAGGGGFLLSIASPKKHQKIREALSDYKLISLAFSNIGSRIIFKN